METALKLRTRTAREGLRQRVEKWLGPDSPIVQRRTLDAIVTVLGVQPDTLALVPPTPSPRFAPSLLMELAEKLAAQYGAIAEEAHRAGDRPPPLLIPHFETLLDYPLWRLALLRRGDVVIAEPGLQSSLEGTPRVRAANNAEVLNGRADRFAALFSELLMMLLEDAKRQPPRGESWARLEDFLLLINATLHNTTPPKRVDRALTRARKESEARNRPAPNYSRVESSGGSKPI